MVTIKEAEALTGIARQNIRYYEKMGLLHPEKYRPTGMPEKRYHLLRAISRIVIPVFLLLLILLPRMLSLKAEHPWEAVIYFLLVIGMAAYLVYVAILYKNYRG